MDCVGCDKCRLWGKLQTAGYGTALKVLFEFDEKDSSNDPPLRRTELVALVNTLDRISHSLRAVRAFSNMIEAREAGLPIETPIQENPQEIGSSDDGLPDVPRRKPRNETQHYTLTEEFWEEFSLVWRTWVWVIRSWVELPGKVWKILIMEMSRLWDFWLGLPMRPRSWEIKFPGRGEL